MKLNATFEIDDVERHTRDVNYVMKLDNDITLDIALHSSTYKYNVTEQFEKTNKISVTLSKAKHYYKDVVFIPERKLNAIESSMLLANLINLQEISSTILFSLGFKFANATSEENYRNIYKE
jgi:hypothetical protein